jgi:hypothetical protein
MPIKQAIILCGGEGKRMLSVTKGEISKCLINVGERPFIYYIIQMLKGMGCSDIVLLARDKRRQFETLEDGVVRVSAVADDDIAPDSKVTIRDEILAIPDLQDIFVLITGDQLPIGNWQGFAEDGKPKVGVKIIGRDTGMAIVTREMVETGEIDPKDFRGMMAKLPNYMMLGTLHIGTPEGLRRARQFIDIAVYGQ